MNVAGAEGTNQPTRRLFYATPGDGYNEHGDVCTTNLPNDHLCTGGAKTLTGCVRLTIPRNQFAVPDNLPADMGMMYPTFDDGVARRFTLSCSKSARQEHKKIFSYKSGQFVHGDAEDCSRLVGMQLLHDVTLLGPYIVAHHDDDPTVVRANDPRKSPHEAEPLAFRLGHKLTSPKMCDFLDDDAVRLIATVGHLQEVVYVVHGPNGQCPLFSTKQQSGSRATSLFNLLTEHTTEYRQRDDWEQELNRNAIVSIISVDAIRTQCA